MNKQLQARFLNELLGFKKMKLMEYETKEHLSVPSFIKQNLLDDIILIETILNKK